MENEFFNFDKVIEIEKKKSYNQALEDFASALIDGEQNEEFVYNIEKIVEILRK